MVERLLGEKDGFCGERNVITWTPCDNISRITESANPAAKKAIATNVDTISPSRKPTAIVLICHGLFEHGIRYTSCNLSFLFIYIYHNNSNINSCRRVNNE